MLKAEYLMHLQTRLGPDVEVGVVEGCVPHCLTVCIRGPVITTTFTATLDEWQYESLVVIDVAAHKYLDAEREARPGRHEEESE